MESGYRYVRVRVQLARAGLDNSGPSRRRRRGPWAVGRVCRAPRAADVVMQSNARVPNIIRLRNSFSNLEVLHISLYPLVT